MSGAPVKELPASSSVGSSSVPVANRGGEEVDVGFSDFGASGRNQLRDPGLGRSAGNDREFSLGNRFHMGPLLYHIKDVMFYIRGETNTKQNCDFLKGIQVIQEGPVAERSRTPTVALRWNQSDLI